MKSFSSVLLIGWVISFGAPASELPTDPRLTTWGEALVDERVESLWQATSPLKKWNGLEYRYQWNATWAVTVVDGEGERASDCPEVIRGAAEAKRLLAVMERSQSELQTLSGFTSPNARTTARIAELRVEIETLGTRITQVYPTRYENRDRALTALWSVDPTSLLAAEAPEVVAAGFEIVRYVFVPTSLKMSDFVWSATQGPLGAEMGVAGEEPFLAPVKGPILRPKVFFIRPTSANRICLGDNSIETEGRFELRFRRRGSSSSGVEETRVFPLRLVLNP